MEPAYLHAHTTCLNCGAAPAGAWCQQCGQRSGPVHRSVRHLLGELVELMTHADHRIWRTLAGLALHPARLTADFLRGRRASQIPPLRLFFVMLLLLFAAGSLTREGLVDMRIPAEDQQKAQAAIGTIHTRHPRFDAWLKPHLVHAVARPDAVVGVMREWLERFTLLMLPIAAVLLSLLTLGTRPRFSFYDHLVFAAHSLSFAGGVQIAVFVAGSVVPGSGVLLLLLPAHLFRHMRGLYGGAAWLTLLRMVVLGLGSLAAVIVLFLVLTWMGLQFAE